MPSESPVMNFEEEKAKLLKEKAALAQKGPKQKLTAKDDTASKRRASALEPAAVEARKHMKRKAAEFDEADADGDREVDFDEFVMYVLPREGDYSQETLNSWWRLLDIDGDGYALSGYAPPACPLLTTLL